MLRKKCSAPLSMVVIFFRKIMALREIRFVVSTGDESLDRELTDEIYYPFTFFMDSLLRGHFQEYSGEEVKGINLVNLRLYTKSKLQQMEAIAGCKLHLNEWTPMLNALQLEDTIDLNDITGARSNKIIKAIQIFSSYASKSHLPQLKRLAANINASVSEDAILSAIKRAEEYTNKCK